jgi:predicted Zn-dependent protease
MEGHRMAATSFSYLFLLGVVFLFIIGKEPTNLIVFAGTNRPQRNGRADYRIILTAFGLLLLVELFALVQYLNLSWAPAMDVLLRPAHLIAVSAVLMPFLSQNQYHFVRRQITTNLSYTFLLAGFSLIAISFFFLVFSQGDELFVAAVERLAIIFFFSMGLVHVIFLFGNHFELFRQRINLYYLMTQGPRIPFAAIWFAGILAVVFAEGSESWKTPRLLLYSQTLQYADHSLLAGDRQEALQEYGNASFFAPGNIKAHYNKASLIVADPRQLRDALIAYRQSTRYRDFPYARLNAANLLAFNNESEAARKMLVQGLHQSPVNPYLANNLGLYYQAAGMADSAILSFRQALEADISLSSVYGNLARLYDQYDRPQDALDFYRAGVRGRNPSAPAICNALYYQLLTQKEVLPKGISGADKDDYFVRYNAQLNALGEGRIASAGVQIKALIAENPTPGALLLDAYLMFLQDSVANARSRMKYIAESFPAQAAPAYHLTGLAYYQRDVLEMARYYFRQAASAGDAYGGLLAAKVELDMGLTDSAFKHLSELRVKDTTLWADVAKEMGMLYSAYGQEVIADTEWDMTSLSLDEKIRVALYADTLHGGNSALNHFLAVLDRDSMASAPYLEMGRIFNRLKDPRAIENLRYGLHLHPENVLMQLEMVRAFLLQGQVDSAQLIWDAVSNDSTYMLETGAVQAELALAQGDTLGAVQKLERIFEADPFRQSVILRLAGLYRIQEAWDKGNRLITTAVNLNDQNPEIWYYYAVFSRAWNLSEDAGYGAVKAIELTADPRRRQAITAEFEAEIRAALPGL